MCWISCVCEFRLVKLVSLNRNTSGVEKVLGHFFFSTPRARVHFFMVACARALFHCFGTLQLCFTEVRQITGVRGQTVSQSLEHLLVREAELTGSVDLGGDVPSQIWRQLKEETPWSKRGDKCVLNRFMGAVRKASTEVKHWAKRSFGYQYVCLEEGY